MQKIPLKLAKAGMVLAKPVVRGDGLTLVGEGTELTETLLARFEQSDVASLTVQGNPVDMDNLPGSTDFSRRVKRLDHLFRKHGNDKFMMTLKAFIGQYFRLKAAAAAAELAAAEAAASGNENDTDEANNGEA